MLFNIIIIPGTSITVVAYNIIPQVLSLTSTHEAFAHALLCVSALSPSVRGTQPPQPSTARQWGQRGTRREAYRWQETLPPWTIAQLLPPYHPLAPVMIIIIIMVMHAPVVRSWDKKFTLSALIILTAVKETFMCE